MSKVRTQILKNLVWGNANILFRYSTAFVVVVLLAKFYSPADFGQYQLAITYLTIFESFSIFHGHYVRNVLIQDPSKESLFITAWIYQWIAVWILTVLFCTVGYFLSDDPVFWLLLMLMCVRLIFKPFEFVSVIADTRLRNDMVQKTQIVMTGTFNLTRAMAALSHMGIAWVYACSAIQGICTTFYQLILKKRLQIRFQFQFDWGEVWNLVRGSFWLSLTGFLGVFQVRLASVILEGKMNEALYGNYQLLFKLIEPAISVGVVVLASNYTVLAHTLQKNPEVFMKRFTKVSGVTLAISVCASTIFLAVPESWLIHFLGTGYLLAFQNLKVGTLLLIANTLLAIGTIYDLLKQNYVGAISQYVGAFLISTVGLLMWSDSISIYYAILVSSLAASLPVVIRYAVGFGMSLFKRTEVRE